MALQQPKSPLDDIPGLIPVSPEAIQRLEDHLSATYLKRMEVIRREQAEGRKRMRKVVLF